MEYRFDPYTRSFSAVYPEYYDAYYSAEDEEEADRRARKRRRMRNLAIGAGTAAALAGGGLLYLRHKGHGNIGAGWSHVKDRAANKLSGGAFDRVRAHNSVLNKKVTQQINNNEALRYALDKSNKERDLYKTEGQKLFKFVTGGGRVIPAGGGHRVPVASLPGKAALKILAKK
jgi:hypothetical protein